MWLLHSSWDRRVGDCSDEGIDFTECGDISDNIGDTSDHQYLELKRRTGARRQQSDQQREREQSGASVRHMTPLPWHNRRGNFTNSLQNVSDDCVNIEIWQEQAASGWSLSLPPASGWRASTRTSLLAASKSIRSFDPIRYLNPSPMQWMCLWILQCSLFKASLNNL